MDDANVATVPTAAADEWPYPAVDTGFLARLQETYGGGQVCSACGSRRSAPHVYQLHMVGGDGAESDVPSGKSEEEDISSHRN